MNAPAVIQSNHLPSLVQRAADALLSAKSSAEVLEARDYAGVAYAAAKTAGRMARAKQAHDTLLMEVYRAQADALLIEAQAKMRLADEYDNAQERGEVSKGGGRPDCVEDHNAVPATAADLGIRRDQTQEARSLRDAEQERPGLAERALGEMLSRGEEPTKAALRREMAPRREPQMKREPLWVWGRVRDFDRDNIMQITADDLARQMTEQMRADMRDHLPRVIAYLTELEQSL